MDIIKGPQTQGIKAVIYGPEGIGKSTLASQFPNPLFIDTEGSTTHMDVARLPTPHSWVETLEQVNWAATHTGEFQTLVLDTVDWAETFCAEQVCAANSKSGIEDFGYGKGYGYWADEFKRLPILLDQLITRNRHVVVLGHAILRKFEQPDEMGSYDRWSLKLMAAKNFSNAATLMEWADLLLFINYRTILVTTDAGKTKAQGGERVVYTTHRPCWDAKTRFPLPEEFPLGYDLLRPIFEPGAPAAKEVSTPPVVVAKAAAKKKPAKAEPAPEPPSPAAPAPVIDPDVPDALRRVMAEAGVSSDEVKGVIASRGFYPFDTPWRVIASNSDFVSGWLMHPDVWTKVVDSIRALREEMPF